MDSLSNTMSTDLHCAGCRRPISQFFDEVYYPACHHVFCPACIRQGLLHEDKFTCPLDYLPVDINAGDSERFYTRLSEWISAESNERERAWNSLKSCVNFVLFPCRMLKGHPGYESCPYDHSMKSQAPEVIWVNAHFCENCRVRVSSGTCPRCHGPCITKQIPHSRPCRPLISDDPRALPLYRHRG